MARFSMLKGSSRQLRKRVGKKVKYRAENKAERKVEK
jgi:hypothetical protein